MLSITKRKKGFTLVEVMITVTVLGVIAALVIPAYQDYVTRSQVAESIALFDGKRPEAESFLTLFDGNENKFFNKTYKNGVSTNYIEASNELYGPDYKGESSYQLGYLYGKISNKPLQGKTIVFFNEKSSKDNYIWNCETNIEQRYLPSSLKCTITDGPIIDPGTPDPGVDPGLPETLQPPFSGDSADSTFWSGVNKKLMIENGEPVAYTKNSENPNLHIDPSYNFELLEIDQYGNKFYKVTRNGVLESELGITPNGDMFEMFANSYPNTKGWENDGFTDPNDMIMNFVIHGKEKNWKPGEASSVLSGKAYSSSKDGQLGNALNKQLESFDMQNPQEILDMFNSRWNFQNTQNGYDYFQNFKDKYK